MAIRNIPTPTATPTTIFIWSEEEPPLFDVSGGDGGELADLGGDNDLEVGGGGGEALLCLGEGGGGGESLAGVWGGGGDDASGGGESDWGGGGGGEFSGGGDEAGEGGGGGGEPESGEGASGVEDISLFFSFLSHAEELPAKRLSGAETHFKNTPETLRIP